MPGKAIELVIFSTLKKDSMGREYSANVRVVALDKAGANLHSLVRNFGACISIQLPFGLELLDRNPTHLDDFWEFDNEMWRLHPQWLNHQRHWVDLYIHAVQRWWRV